MQAAAAQHSKRAFIRLSRPNAECETFNRVDVKKPNRIKTMSTQMDYLWRYKHDEI